jgi:16S rRNA (adenine1518-N6/adenine1519-N6)-dimethyltransferase
MTQTPTTIIELLRRHGIHVRKHLGQHFLADPNIVDTVVRVAGVGPGDQVVEVGAGTGVLTRALADAGCQVVAYEIDRRLEPILAETVGSRADIRFADALEVLADELGPGSWVLVANLPYNVGTPLLLQLLTDAKQIRRFVVMVQREVADRLTAEPGSKVYGVPSVVVSLVTRAERALTVPPQVFVPPPKIESAVLVLDRRDDVDVDLARRAAELARVAFGQRRKMMRSTLGSEVVEKAGVDPSARPEDLSPADYLRLAEAEGA